MLKKEQEEGDAYLLSLQENKKFQKYFVRGRILPVLERLRDMKWLYEDKTFISASDEDIADIIRQNRNTHTAVVALVSPVLSEEDRETF